MIKCLFPGIDKFSKNELAEIYNNLNSWKWDCRIGPKPKDWDEIPNHKPYYTTSKALYVIPILEAIENKISDKYCLWWYHKNVLKRTSRIKFEHYWYFKSIRRKLSNGI